MAHPATFAPSSARLPWVQMPRDLRHEVVNAIYHVTQHATGDEALFRDPFDRYFFERLLDRTLTIYGLDLIAYCQLDNHYHLLLRLRKATLAAGMQFLNGRYVQGFNERHDRRGTLVRGRYTSTIVETEDHYVNCLVYIAMNPVKAGLCRHPEEWEWGSYGGRGSLARPPDPLLQGFFEICLA
jgi:putative transposase